MCRPLLVRMKLLWSLQASPRPGAAAGAGGVCARITGASAAFKQAPERFARYPPFRATTSFPARAPSFPRR